MIPQKRRSAMAEPLNLHLPKHADLSRLLGLLLGACTAAASDSDDAASPLRCACSSVALPAAVATETDLAVLLAEVGRVLYPEQGGVSVGIGPVDHLKYFRAWTELDTLSLPPRERRYTIHYDPAVLAEPPAPAALAAVFAHELGHVDDYLGMDSTALVEFAAWYAGEDPTTSASLAEYERATDEKALARGCADGLRQVREWIYAHADEATEAEKRRNYYTPEEIDAWVEENGGCP